VCFSLSFTFLKLTTYKLVHNVHGLNIDLKRNYQIHYVINKTSKLAGMHFSIYLKSRLNENPPSSNEILKIGFFFMNFLNKTSTLLLLILV
jgi:hypothetical protein